MNLGKDVWDILGFDFEIDGERKNIGKSVLYLFSSDLTRFFSLFMGLVFYLDALTPLG